MSADVKANMAIKAISDNFILLSTFNVDLQLKLKMGLENVRMRTLISKLTHDGVGKQKIKGQNVPISPLLM